MSVSRLHGQKCPGGCNDNEKNGVGEGKLHGGMFVAYISGLVGMKGEKINSMTRSRVLRHHTLLFCAEANGTNRVHSISIGLLLMVLIARSRTLLQLFIEGSCSLHPERE